MSGQKGSGVFALRIGGAIAASVVFGLIATTAFIPWDFWRAVLLGFLFGTAFIGGTGYRIILGVIRVSSAAAPASWSGATAGAALYATGLFAIALLNNGDGALVMLAFGMAIGVAYLPIKLACLRVGCCTTGHGHRTPADIDLRMLEVGLTLAVLASAGALAFVHAGIAALVAVGGHLGIRIVSRHMRNRAAWGWPPLHQPGAELAPLALLCMLSAWATL